MPNPAVGCPNAGLGVNRNRPLDICPDISVGGHMSEKSDISEKRRGKNGGSGERSPQKFFFEKFENFLAGI
jgi:hypothetical protein